MLLTEIYYLLLWGLTVFFLVKLIYKPELIYEYPFMISFGFVVFLIPQVYVVYEKGGFKTDFVNRLFLMCLLCWGMAFAGWHAIKPQRPILGKIFFKTFNENRFGLVGALYIALGAAFNFIASRIIATEEFANQQATGVVTIFIFFQHLLFIGTGMCLCLYLKKPSRFLLFASLAGILFGFYIGILQGRRTQTLYTLMVLGIPLFLSRGIKPARSMVVAGLLTAFLVIPSIGQYREILSSSDSAGQFFSRLSKELDFKKNLEVFYLTSDSYELINAGYMIDYSYRNSEYHFGSGFWNELVFRFVPAQIVGKDVKYFLMIKHENSSGSFNPNYILGTTTTGIGDSFLEFDYFGCVLFLLLGIMMRNFWYVAKRTDNLFYQVLYSVIIIECLLALTHGTIWFLPGFLTAFIFLFIAYKLVKINE